MRALGLLVCLFAAATPALFPEEDWRAAVQRSIDLESNGRYIEAKAVLMDALEAARRHPAESERSGIVLWRLGRACNALGEYDEASLRYRASIVQLGKALGEAHPTLAIVVSGYSSLLEARGEWKEAERLRLLALPVLERELGARHRSSMAVRIGLANGYRARRDYVHAEEAIRKGIEACQPDAHECDAEIRQSWTILKGYVLLETGRSEEAVVAFERAISFRAGPAALHDLTQLDARYGLALAQFLNGRRMNASENLKEIESWATGALGRSHPMSLRIMEARSKVLRALGQMK